MLLKTKHCPTSQAGRRRFESGLPLHIFNQLAHSRFSFFTLFTSKTLNTRRISCADRSGRGSVCQGSLEFRDRFEAALKIALRVRINGHADRVAALVCGNLRVHSFLVAETSLCPAQDLEVHPSETDLLKFLMDVPPEKIIARQKSAAFRRKYQPLRARIDRDLAPTINIRHKIWRQSGLPLSTLGFRIVGKTAVDTLSNFYHFRINLSPPKRENLSGAHSNQDS